MKKNRIYKFSILFVLLLLLTTALIGCVQSDTRNSTNLQSGNTGKIGETEEADEATTTEDITEAEVIDTEDSVAQSQELEVRFGDEGAAFTMHLYDNETAATIANYVGTGDWRLPIYNTDEYENHEVMQYYDIPDRFEIPSNPETVMIEEAGAVYYSHPNRIVLFYQDGEVTGDYTQIGYFDYTEEFQDAVIHNPMLEGWENKVVLISRRD